MVPTDAAPEIPVTSTNRPRLNQPDKGTARAGAITPAELVPNSPETSGTKALLYAVEFSYAIRSKPVELSFVGIVSVNVPAVIVCEPNVWTLTALLPCVAL